MGQLGGGGVYSEKEEMGVKRSKGIILLAGTYLMPSNASGT